MPGDAVEPVETVVLDLDGTLVDSVFVHTVAWAAAFRDVGVEVESWRLHRAIGMGGDRLVAHVAGEATERAVGDEVRDRHARQLDRRFDEIRPLDGAADLVAELDRRGLRLVLASSGEQELTDRLLGLLDGLADLLDEVVSGSEAESSKPAGDLVRVALERVDSARGLVLGDAVWDVAAARDAGVPAIGLLTGGFGAAELSDAGAVATYDGPRALLDHLDDTPLRGTR